MPIKQLLAALGVFLFTGCTFGPPPPDTLEVYEGPKRPVTQVARVANSNAAALLAVDGKPVRGISWIPGTLRHQITYEMLPGNHRLRVARAVGEGTSSKPGHVCDIVAVLIAGREYRFVTQSRTSGSDIQWECRLVDAESNSTVGQVVPLDPPLRSND